MKCENLDVWKRGCQLSVLVYKYFANCKDYSFKDQITRASLSIPSNIAEGLEKESDKEKARYIEHAQGSAAELHTQTLIGAQIGYIDQQTAEQWKDETTQLAKMLNTLKKHMKQ
ncbi:MULTISPECIES: four helix bundle protein [Chrysiogenaceae]|uniref:Four helix bundle protein n=1 Tax=Desulfurispira natronophila TaxID=682562 RepID=A0A7W8DHR5_9BACT|nr:MULTISPECIES: four helix bundle protein [Chrysiogenaceae]MBB5022861.1 four helix bundle protein [Desulfurispira natronophila]UCZ56543.1 four helix bundle protein [Desulfurispirillum indicum]